MADSYLTDITFDDVDAQRVESVDTSGTVTYTNGPTALAQTAAPGPGVALTSSTGLPAFTLNLGPGTDINVKTAAIAAAIPMTMAIALTVNVIDIIQHVIWGTGWFTGTTFNLVNSSTIHGLGGDGGPGNHTAPFPADDGFPGNDAIDLDGNTINIDNAAGNIFGGGGGGGSGTYAGGSGAGCSTNAAPGGGGGGAGNSLGGTQGFNGGANFHIGSAATDGETPGGAIPAQTGGAAGVGAFIICNVNPAENATGGNGGTGGNYGAAGTAGTLGSTTMPIGPVVQSPAGAGGAAGKAINLSGGTANFTAGNNPAQVKGAVS